ncbi:MAG: cephalosporin hydroxylase family protein [Betaproteobacteria bacterium]|nr:cephalosporin hydroxylase family protein [Betaproteobacteria bacterium]
MYDQTLVTAADTRLTLTTAGASTEVDLYSRQGLETVAALWLKLSAAHRLMYEHTWLGVPVIQLPGDIVAMQELIWRTRPDFIVECGFAHGGSAVLYASILELLGKGQVIGVDVEVRSYNRAAILAHPLAHRIRIVEASSIEQRTREAIGRAVSGAAQVMVILDSNHSRGHVAAELELYHSLVTPGSYLVAMDGAQAHVWDTPRGKAEWREDNPLPAMAAFLASHPEFETDPYWTRAHVTSSPGGYLRRRPVGEWRPDALVVEEVHA